MSDVAKLPDNEKEPEADEVDRYRMPLLEHLKELRTRLMRTTIVVGINMVISLAFATQILEFLVLPVDEALIAAGMEPGGIVILGPFEGIYTWFKCAFLGAIVLSTPMIAWQSWGFIAPGLYKTERKIVIPLSASSTVLFLAGAAFAYYVLFPVAFPFFFTVIEAEVAMGSNAYLSAIVKMMLAFGVCFQLPVGTFFLARMGLIDAKDLIGGFRYAMVGIFVIAAFLTPPDIMTQSLLAVPLVFLYGIGIIVARIFSTKVRD